MLSTDNHTCLTACNSPGPGAGGTVVGASVGTVVGVVVEVVVGTVVGVVVEVAAGAVVGAEEVGERVVSIAGERRS